MSSVEVFEQPGSSPSGPITREELYAEVWQRPMTKIAERYGVSSSFMARVCTRMNVPRPPRGHWAKLENGKSSPQPPLPEACPGDLQVWSRGDVMGPISQPLPKAPSPRVFDSLFDGHPDCWWLAPMVAMSIGSAEGAAATWSITIWSVLIQRFIN
ncbi:hypothetical protein D3C85_840350 [compost metagenome]